MSRNEVGRPGHGISQIKGASKSEDWLLSAEVQFVHRLMERKKAQLAAALPSVEHLFKQVRVHGYWLKWCQVLLLLSGTMPAYAVHVCLLPCWR